MSAAVLYAINPHRLAAFYTRVAGLTVQRIDPESMQIGGPGVELTLVQIPPDIAATITLTTPPQRREDSAVKLVFEVPNLANAREVAITLGGVIDPGARQWRHLHWTVCDGHDPEGNVLQLRERAALEASAATGAGAPAAVRGPAASAPAAARGPAFPEVRINRPAAGAAKAASPLVPVGADGEPLSPKIQFSRSIRMPMHGTMFFMFLGGVIFAFYPFYLETRRMEAFCSGLPAGTSHAEIVKLALAQDYEVSPLKDNRAEVDDPPSGGRRTCDLQFGPQGLVSAKRP
jgi:predicted enzyme related to lactoylglutathione lyase